MTNLIYSFACADNKKCYNKADYFKLTIHREEKRHRKKNLKQQDNFGYEVTQRKNLFDHIRADVKRYIGYDLQEDFEIFTTAAFLEGTIEVRLD